MVKVNLKSKYVIIAIAFLLVLVCALAWFNRPSGDLEPNTLSVLQNDSVLKTFSLADIKALPAIDVKKTIQSSKEADDSGVFTGVPLEDVLNAIDKNLLINGTEFIVRAEDGFAITFSKNDVLEENNILVAYAKEGQSLGASRDGGTGPFRIVVVGDSFGNRCTKYLNEIEVK
jgi:DMSO/TMAO reductase YedYZ molybdopterin-dependent catalytic subunit